MRAPSSANPTVAAWLILLLGTLVPLMAQVEVLEPAPPPAKTISSSKQFIVRGADQRVRGAVASIGEELKRELERFLPMDPEQPWKHPIVVSLEGEVTAPRPPAPFKRNIVTGNRLYQLRCHLGQGLQLNLLEEQLLQLILFEFSLREIPDDQLTAGMEVPAWAVAGLLEAIRFRNDRSDRRAYQRLYDAGALMGVDELLAVKNSRDLDAATRGIFTASSGALVLALTSQDGGPVGLANTLEALILDPAEPRATLQREFPGLQLGAKSLEKWWALQLANMATPLQSDSLDIRESDRRLESILTLRLVDPDSGEATTLGIDDWQQVMDHPGKLPPLREAQQRLSRLSFRCFPEYRPFILEYARILSELARAEEDDTSTRLTNLRADRNILLQLADRTRDYLDWYLITQPGATPGRFSDYQQALEQLRAATKKSSDPISTYLDAVERFHQQP